MSKYEVNEAILAAMLTVAEEAKPDVDGNLPQEARFAIKRLSDLADDEAAFNEFIEGNA